MEIDPQWIINGLFGLLMFSLGYILNGVRQSVADLHDQDMRLADKVSGIEVLVAGTYVKRDEMDKLSDAIFKKLDRIENKIDAKADK